MHKHLAKLSANDHDPVGQALRMARVAYCMQDGEHTKTLKGWETLKGWGGWETLYVRSESHHNKKHA
jgi:hypothetical protein